jgi:hypothetical protein
MAMDETRYQVRVSGLIPAELLTELGDLSVTIEPAETVLHGPLPDQSSLFDLLARIHERGLRLIEVRRLAGGDSSGAESPE